MASMLVNKQSALNIYVLSKLFGLNKHSSRYTLTLQKANVKLV